MHLVCICVHQLLITALCLGSALLADCKYRSSVRNRASTVQHCCAYAGFLTASRHEQIGSLFQISAASFSSSSASGSQQVR